MLKIRFRMFLLFPALHLIAAWILLTNPQWLLILALSIILYSPIHNIGFSIGYHKLFAHRSFKPKTFYPYLATFIGMLSLYGGPLASSLIHREHHKFADEDRDPHSPTKGLWHAYVGWTWSYTKHGNHLLRIYDLIRDYPWTAKIEKYDLLVPLTVYPILFWISPVFGCAVLIACMLSLHTGMLTNTVTHTRQGDILNLIWLANWVNPIFNHKHHHATHGYDYTTEQVKDKQAWFIKKFLMK
jgi:stearoyl-CoA desaturase (delta-9 desaturase)